MAKLKFTCPFLSQSEVQYKQNEPQFTVKSFRALCAGMCVHYMLNQAVLYRAGSFSRNFSTASPTGFSFCVFAF